MQRLTNRITGFYENYAPPRTSGGIEDFRDALAHSDNLEPLDRLPTVVKPRADWGGISTLLILAVTWGAAAWIMFSFREVGQ